MKKISIIGLGNMGSAILGILIKTFDPKNIFVSDHDLGKLNKTQNEFDLPEQNCSIDPNEILPKADIIMLTIKPQSFDDFANNLTIDLTNKLVISIMAGVSIDKISKKLNTSKIIRSMPNLCLQVSMALTGWIASNEVSENEKEIARTIFKSFGEEIELQDESKINDITALSGSGPAYFFHLCELLEEKAKELGFDEKEARKIANTTFIGSALTLNPTNPLSDKGGISAAEFRKAVTSKGGTTEAALNYMNENKFDQIFMQAISEAKTKAEKLK